MAVNAWGRTEILFLGVSRENNVRAIVCIVAIVSIPPTLKEKNHVTRDSKNFPERGN